MTDPPTPGAKQAPGSQKFQPGQSPPSELRVLLVRERGTRNMERYIEVVASGQREILRKVYVDRVSLAHFLADVGGPVPEVIEVTIRAVDPQTLRRDGNG